jgi:hypothetical protein
MARHWRSDEKYKAYQIVSDCATKPGHAEALQRIASSKGGIPWDHARGVVHNILLVLDFKSLSYEDSIAKRSYRSLKGLKGLTGGHDGRKSISNLVN